MAGYSTYFQPTIGYFCRYCGLNGEEIQNIDNSSQARLLNGDSVSNTEQIGAKLPFSLEGLPGIDRWNLFPPDTMHDLSKFAP